MNFSKITLLLATAGALSACAPKVPGELISARGAYAVASEGPAATLVPAELHKAGEALASAEASFEKDPRGFRTVDLSYIALRKTELAVALSTAATEQQRTTTANADYQATQDMVMRDTKAQLGASQTDLAATQAAASRTDDKLATARADGERTAAQLSASESARAMADARTAEAMAALAKLAAVKEEARGLVITLSGSVLFGSDQATLLPDAQKRLSDVSDAILATEGRKVVIEGHTDSQGTEAHNLDLSQRRADAVRSFLLTRGYDAALVRGVGIGESRPVADNETAEGRANNRRVEIILEPVSVATK